MKNIFEENDVVCSILCEEAPEDVKDQVSPASNAGVKEGYKDDNKASTVTRSSMDSEVHEKADWSEHNSGDHERIADHSRMLGYKKEKQDPNSPEVDKHAAIAKFHDKMAAGKDWFDSMPDEQKKKYIELHPGSKYATGGK